MSQNHRMKSLCGMSDDRRNLLLLADTSTDIFDAQVYENAILYYPDGRLSEYQSKDCWKNFLLMHPFDCSEFTGVEFIDAPERDKKVIGIYDIQGHSVSSDKKGIKIVKFYDGTVRKLINK